MQIPSVTQLCKECIQPEKTSGNLHTIILVSVPAPFPLSRLHSVESEWNRVTGKGMVSRLQLDDVPRKQTSRLLLSYYSSRSHGTVCTTTCKGRNYCGPRDPASWQKMAAIPDDCERTATVYSAANNRQPGLSVDNHSFIAASDTLSTVFEQPLGRS